MLPPSRLLHCYNRYWQRKLGWGDVLATKEDVELACSEGSADELMAIMPYAKSLSDTAKFALCQKLFEKIFREGERPQA